MKTVGKRRMAREMALQMLYQHDLGGATAAQIFRVFDRAPYLTGNGWDDAGEDGKPKAKPPRPRPKRTPEEGERRRREVEEAFGYAQTLVAGTLDHLEEVNHLISEQADNWRLERMPAVDRNILRLAVYELLYEEGIPKLVVVDEAIELAKKFSTDQSSRFVNGLLDGILKRKEL
ncbi:MAG TPA: transcription antitermination factor NusB [Thermoanaerobaculia bacterium]